MKHLLTILLFVCVFVANSQALTVQSSVPVNGSSGIPTSTTISVTFSSPIDPSAQFPNGLPINVDLFDEDSIIVTGTSLSANNQTGSMNVVLQPNNDYVAVVVGAVTPSGDSLDIPYVVNFSTAPSMGNRQVSGTVTVGESGAYKAVVVLDRVRPYSGSGNVVQATVVSNSQGTFTLPYTRNGVYWPIGVLDSNGDGIIDIESGDDYGFYDPDNDGEPDSIVVNNNNLTGVNLHLTNLYAEITARQRLTTANALAQSVLPDFQLFFVYGYDLNVNGRSFGWGYLYRSLANPNIVAMVSVSPFYADIDTSHQNPYPPQMLSLPSIWIDSDQAMNIAEQNGGSNFRAIHPNAIIEMLGANFFLYDSSWQNRFVWNVIYNAPGEDEPSLEIYIDMQTGQVLRVTDVKESMHANIPSSILLEQNYPNPFNPETSITFSIPTESDVSLSIYNVQGQLVDKLLNSRLSSGKHSVTWNAKNLPSGNYFYKLQVGDQIQMMKMTLMK